MQDRWGITIRGKHIPHNVAARDWYCRCGHKIVTRFFEEEPHWRSVCSNDETHDPDEFVHTKAIPYVQHQVMREDRQAQRVLEHLPEEFKKEIQKGGRHAD